MKVKFYIFFVLLSLYSTLSARHRADSLSVAKRDSVFVLQPVPDDGPWMEEAPDILTEGMLLPINNNDSIQRYIDLAHTVMAKVRSLQNFITNIDEASKVELPVGISREIGGLRYDIAIYAIRLKPAYTEIDVFMEFEVPQNKQVLTFMAKGIKFTKKGGIVGDAKLQLLTDYAINFNGDKVQLILKGGGSGGGGFGTYVTMDCDGFKEMSLDAAVKISRDLLRPENPDGSQGTGNVQANFSITLSNWNDLILQLSLPNFQVTGLKGVGFSVSDAVFDFSDLRNAPAVVFPAGYESTQFLPDNPNLWRGFYLRQLTVSLPPEFAPERPTFKAENVLIDNMGISGKFTGTNLISTSKGKMNGWAFSLDSLGITLQANQLVSAGFNGGIVIPIGKEDQPFEYKAIINTGGNYVFNVSPSKDMTFPLWGAGKVEIYEASYLDIKVLDGKFLPKANLHGRMSINASLSQGGQGVSLADITFENLEIQSIKPYIKIGNFSFGSEALQQKMAGFPISIQDIGLRSLDDTQVGLDFTLKLNLVGESSGSFAADAGLTLVGTMDSERGWQSWKYKTILVNEIGVDIDGGSFKINGRLIFYRNDITYGDGFNGTVKAEFTPGLKVTATAIFGNVGGMRYWYADAMVNFPTGIPIFTGVGIYGFGGGIYYAMKMDNQGIGSDLGRTASGVVYVPDTKAGLGLKAVINLASSPKPEAFNADVTFEISFFRGGGVRYIAFGGNGYLVTPGLDIDLGKLKEATGKMAGAVKKLEGKMSDATMGLVKGDGSQNSATEIFGEIGDKAGQKGQISAKVLIDYDFENHVLHGNFEVFINVAGGLIQGIGPGGRAGWAVMHFAPGEWYVYAGTPDDRVGVALGVGSIRVASTSYFMVGTKILGSPPPPVEVQRILNGNFDYMKDLNALGKGAGFAFGASLSVSTGNLSFLMFYGHFDAGAGFDIMIKNYGDVHCKGSDKRIGINGWYANGQAYAYFDGEIGIRVKVFGRKKSISILDIAAAALLQAQLPNPIWLQGTVGGRFSVLGGLVKGNCKFQVTLGNKCELERSAESILDDIKVISEITPAQDEKDVNVFNTPQAVFNMPVNKTFEIVDMESGSNDRRSFRINLDHFKLIADGKEVVGTTEWNDAQDVLAFNSYEILPPKKDVKAVVQVSFEELVNGRWTVVVGDGQKVIQKMENVFTTGEAPDHIPLSNVAYSYPLINQTNFYKNEIPDGYIKLKKAQPYLFEPGLEWRQKGRFTADDGSLSLFDFAYTYSTNEINFNVPADLKTGQTYLFELVNLPAQESGAVDRNVKTETNKVQGETESVDLEMTARNAEGTIENLQEKSIFTTSFRSSQYTRLQDKLANQQITNTFRFLRIPWYTHYLSAFLAQNETFDKAELSGNEYTGNKPLITLEADLTSNDYYNNDIYPLVYDGYPLDGNIKVTRDVSVMGLPPVKAVSIYQDPADIEITNGVLNKTSYQALRYDYDLPSYMIADFADIQRQVVARYIYQQTVSPRIEKLLISGFPILKEGTYKVNLKYHLPGRDDPQYVKPLTFVLKLSEN